MEFASTLLDEKQKGGLGSVNDGFYESKREWMGKRHFLLAHERLLLGFALGLSSYVVPVYVAEITPKDLRGGFVGLNLVNKNYLSRAAPSFMLCIGIAIAYILGVFISCRILVVVGLVPNVSQLIGLFFILESPRWLVKIHKESEFKAALQRLRGSSADISREAADIKEYTEAVEQASTANIFELFQRKYAYTLTVGIGLFALSQLVGTNGVIYYASSIFESVGLSTKLGSIMMGIVKVPTSFISLLLMDRFGRRPLLMVSTSGLCLSCLFVGLSFVLQVLSGFSPYLALIGLLVNTLNCTGSLPFALHTVGVEHLVTPYAEERRKG